ncbi:MAG: hypothetical protein PHR77_04730 [Kiritimatiellae bacterium]|nr:hypothetical protein [Kiritimatiellia bacterium]MDD5519467.1 hypothetical protein [Kiritimatiellia bacterium]
MTNYRMLLSRQFMHCDYRASNNNLRAVQRTLSHSRITTTQIYADVLPDVMRDSMTAMERLANSCRRGVNRFRPVEETVPELEATVA